MPPRQVSLLLKLAGASLVDRYGALVCGAAGSWIQVKVAD